jgi:hypothetical protein
MNPEIWYYSFEATTTIKKIIIIMLIYKVWKYDIRNIYLKYIKVYTDIDPTVDFVFPVNKIDCENSEKLVSQDKFEVNQMRIQKL